MARRPRGFGHVYRRQKRLADGSTHELPVWWIAYYVHGRLVRENTGTIIKTEAEKVLRSKTIAVDRGETVEPAAQATTLEGLERLVDTDYRNNRRASLKELRRAYRRLKGHGLAPISWTPSERWLRCRAWRKRPERVGH